MKVIVDASVWSLVLRRKQPGNQSADILHDLICDRIIDKLSTNFKSQKDEP